MMQIGSKESYIHHIRAGLRTHQVLEREAKGEHDSQLYRSCSLAGSCGIHCSGDYTEMYRDDLYFELGLSSLSCGYEVCAISPILSIVTLVILKSRSNEYHSLVSTIGAYIAMGDWLYLKGNGLKPKAAQLKRWAWSL